jgi:signal transduction histidine kinase
MRWRLGYRNTSLQFKFGVQAALSTVLLFVLVMILVLYVQQRALRSSVEARGFDMTTVFARSSAPAVAANDYVMMQYVVKGLTGEARVRYAMILRPDGEVFVHTTPRERGAHYTDALSRRSAEARTAFVHHYVAADGVLVYDFTVPVQDVVTGKQVASARVGLSIKDELEEVSRTGKSIVLLGLAALAFSLVWAAYQSRKLTRPLEALVEGTQEITRGNLSHRLPERSSDEIGQLSGAFNRMATELATAQSNLVEKTRMAAIGEISARVAHETRNPLGALSNCLQLLRRNPGDAREESELLDIMQTEVQRLNGMVSDFLTFGRPRPPRLEPVDLEEIVAGVLRLLERDQRSGGRIEVVTSATAPRGKVYADPAQLHQILWNLLLNATQAVNGSGRVALHTEYRGDTVEIAISDTGRGIDPETLPKIFDPFFTTRSNGSGLGLAIVKRIIEDHGGAIRVESQAGHGTTVRVELPCHD